MVGDVSADPTYELSLECRRRRGTPGTVEVSVWVNKDPSVVGSGSEVQEGVPGLPGHRGNRSARLRLVVRLGATRGNRVSRGPDASLRGRPDRDLRRSQLAVRLLRASADAVRRPVTPGPDTDTRLARPHLPVRSPDSPMDRVVRPVVGFQWGFRMHDGRIDIVAPRAWSCPHGTAISAFSRRRIPPGASSRRRLRPNRVDDPALEDAAGRGYPRGFGHAAGALCAPRPASRARRSCGCRCWRSAPSGAPERSIGRVGKQWREGAVCRREPATYRHLGGRVLATESGSWVAGLARLRRKSSARAPVRDGDYPTGRHCVRDGGTVVTGVLRWVVNVIKPPWKSPVHG